MNMLGSAAVLAKMTGPIYEEDGIYKLPLTVSEEHLNFHDTFHGGMQYFYALEALSQYMTHKGIAGVGMEGSIHYYRAAKPGDKMVASIYERKVGRTVGTYSVEITRGEDLIADTLFTIMFGRK